MKRSIIVIMIFFVLGCNSQPNSIVKNDLDEINAFGKVKSIKGFVYKYDNGKDSKKQQLFVQYNALGYKEEVNWYGNDGNVSSKQFYNYDSIHNTVEIKRYVLDTVLKYRAVNQIDKRGNVIQKLSYKPDGSLLKTYKYTYNNKGYKTEMIYIIHYSTRDDYSKWTYEYDSKGYLIKARSFKEDGIFKFEQTFKNDKNGNELEWIRYTSEGAVDFKINREFDDYGNEVKYHMHGGAIEDKDAYKYTYDSSNNWVEKQHFKDGKQTLVEIREIEYYK